MKKQSTQSAKKVKKTTKKLPELYAILFIIIGLIILLSAIKQAQTFLSHAATSTINAATAAFPTKLFAPYVYVAISPTFDFNTSITTAGQKFYILAFILNGGGTCTPTWNGSTPLSQDFLYDQINQVRSAGGDVIISFGGAGGTELGRSCTSAQTLQAAYQQVISQYKLRWIDLDIEGDTLSDTASVDMRNTAVAALQKANPGLRVSYTLPVGTDGLPQDALNLLSNAKSAGVNVNVVNIMTMDYGSADSQMGQDAINATNATIKQLNSIGVNASIGITPMIGQNDVSSEIFQLSDAQLVVSSVSTIPQVSLISMWASNRDYGTCAGQSNASDSCSGVSQSALQFTTTFNKFTSASTSSPNPSTGVVPSSVCLGGQNCGPSSVPSGTAPSNSPGGSGGGGGGSQLSQSPSQPIISGQPSGAVSGQPSGAAPSGTPSQGSQGGLLGLLILLLQFILKLLSQLKL